MLKNKIIVKKIRNIIILFMVLIIMLGVYSNIRKSRAEEVTLITATAIDNYGYLENEELKLEVKSVKDNLYEIELPEDVNSKKINQIVKITLDDQKTEIESENLITDEVESGAAENTATDDSTQVTTIESTVDSEILEIVDNKIYLTKEQMDSKVISMEVIYDISLLQSEEDGIINKKLLAEMTEQERTQVNILENTELLYNKILKYEDEENAKLVEVRGYLPKDIELQVEEVTQEKLKEIFGEKKIDVAYDIKLIRKITTYVPVDENKPDGELKEVIEIIEIDPKQYGENCEVLIQDINIQEQSKVYHVKDDNTYEQVDVKENTQENISFEASTFSIYAVSSVIDENTTVNLDEGISTTGVGEGGYLEFTGDAPDNYYTSATVTVTHTSSAGGLILGCGWYTSSSTAPSANIDPVRSTTSTWSTHGTYYFNILYAYDLDSTTYTYSYGPFYIDREGPTAPTVSKNPSTSDWTSSSVTVSASGSSDSTSPAVGFSYYQYKTSSSGSYTSGSSVTLSSSGSYTVYFRGVDKLGNTGSATSTTVKIDKTKPTITLASNSNTTWAKSRSVTVTVADGHSGLASGGSLKYGWSTSTSTEPSSYTTVNLSNSSGASSTTFSASASGLTGKYYLWVVPITVNDELGNSNTTTVKSTGTFYFDNTNPTTMTLSSNSNTTWAKSHSVTVTMGDEHSGLSTSNSIKYGWSTSNTTEPSSYTTASLSYSSGATSATFTATNSTLSGQYYLWVVPTTYEDVAGNSNTTTVVSTGLFYFDNTDPMMTLGANSNTSWAKSHSVTVTLTDSHSGIASGANIKYGWSTSTSTEPSSYTTASLSYTAGTNSVSFIATGSGYTGKYYLWVVSSTLNDVVGNSYATTIKSTGTFWYDNTIPTTMTLSSNSNTTWAKEHSVTVTMGDEHSGLSTSNSIKYGWSTSTTTEPSSYTTATLSYSSGATSATFTASNSSLTGKYYLWVVPTTYEDVAGNANTTTVKSTGTFWFDNTAPTITLEKNSNTSWAQTHNVKVTISDPHSGLASGAVVKYGWSTSTTYEPNEYWWADLSYSEGDNSVSFTASGSGYTGKYYLWIVPTTLADLVGNEQTENNLSTGTFYFDNIPPTIKLEAEAIQDGLIASYDAYNNTGNGHDSSAITWVDLVGGDNDGTISGATFENEEYLSLDGVDDWVNLGIMNFTEQVTLETTIVLNEIEEGGANHILGNWQNGGVGIGLLEGIPYVEVYLNGIGYVGVYSSETLEVGQKYHIIGTYDGSSVKLYVNGELKGEEEASGEIGNPEENTVMAIGVNPKGNGINTITMFTKIDVYDVRIYDRALTADEVDYNVGISDGITQNGLIADYQAYNNTGTGHDSSATTWVDLYGADNNGTITGATFKNEEYLLLDGVDDWVNLGQMSFTEQVTFEATIVMNEIQTGDVCILGNWEMGGGRTRITSRKTMYDYLY